MSKPSAAVMKPNHSEDKKSMSQQNTEQNDSRTLSQVIQAGIELNGVERHLATWEQAK
jgi:hypothetical protein